MKESFSVWLERRNKPIEAIKALVGPEKLYLSTKNLDAKTANSLRDLGVLRSRKDYQEIKDMIDKGDSVAKIINHLEG